MADYAGEIGSAEGLQGTPHQPGGSVQAGRRDQGLATPLDQSKGNGGLGQFHGGRPQLIQGPRAIPETGHLLKHQSVADG